MEAKDVQSLQEAYASMYTTSEEVTDLQESVETVEEGIMGALKKVGKAVLGPADQSPEAEAARMGKRRGPGTAGSPKKQQPAAGSPKKQQPASMKEDADVFDIVKEYLMTEHDATEEEALKVMLELTDDERTAIVEMAPMKHVSTTPSGQKRYSTKDDGRHQRGVSPDGKPGGVNAPRTVGPTGAAIYNTVRGLKKRIGL